MEYQRFGDRYVVRLQSGEELMSSLTDLLKREGVQFANLSAAGAVRWVRLGYWNAESRQYEYREFEEQLEIVSFQGNCSIKDGQPFLHLHGVFGRRDFSTIGGHITEARIHPTIEVWLSTEEIAVHRTRDQATGLDLLDLPSRVR